MKKYGNGLKPRNLSTVRARARSYEKKRESGRKLLTGYLQAEAKFAPAVVETELDGVAEVVPDDVKGEAERDGGGGVGEGETDGVDGVLLAEELTAFASDAARRDEGADPEVEDAESQRRAAADQQDAPR